MRLARRPRSILYRHLANPGAVKARQCRNEAVQFPVQVHVLQHFRPVSLERRPEVPQIHARRLRHQPVRHARRNLARDRVIYPLLAPARSDVVAFVHLCQQRRNVFRSMLQVAIHRDNHVALGLMEARRQRRRLSEIPPQPDHLQRPVRLHQIRQQFQAAVRRRIVHEHDLVRSVNSYKHRRQAVIERQDGRFFVMDGDDNRQHFHDSYQFNVPNRPVGYLR